jgi:hypothetical protein
MVVVTSKVINTDEQETLVRLGATVLSKEVRGRGTALAEIREAMARAGAPVPVPVAAAEGHA